MTQSQIHPDQGVFVPKPTEVKQRFNSLDVLRGFAVLAIFAVNIKMMANGFNHYRFSSFWEGDAAPLIAWLLSNFVHGKFITIFTVLFGAGLALLLARDEPVPVGIVLRRLFWLAVFGGIHLIFIREGDILIWYALVGFLAVPFAKLSSRSLFTVGLGLQVLVFIYYTVAPLSDTDIPTLWLATPDAHQDVAAIMLGPVSGQIAARLEAAPYYMVDLLLVGGFWIETLGKMLLGMAFLKSGFLGGRLPIKHYILWGVLGLFIATANDLLTPFLDVEDKLQGVVLSITSFAHYYGGALAWSALIIGCVSMGWKGSWLAAVGRTAFTVYILQSVIGLLLFSSLGFGLFGQLSLFQLMIVTLIVWGFFLCAAPLWLRYFRFGPLEWIWRSLTYQKVQRFRR